MAKEVRVTHVVPALFAADGGVLGGAERYALELARHMAERVPTRLVTFGPQTRELRDGALDIKVLGKPWRVRGQDGNPFAFRLLGEIRRADVIHCHQQHILASSLLAAGCRLTGRRVFVSDLGGGGWDVSTYLSTDRWYHGHLHISEYSRSVFGHAGKVWAHVVLGGVDTHKFSPDPGVARDDTVLFVGRLLPHKGVNYLVEAVPNDMQLEIIGQAYAPPFVAELHRLAGGKQVRFRADCDDQELVRAYRRALCLVLPSVYRSPFGHDTQVPELLGQTLLEAMACATPVIATDVASLPEVVDHGVTGFVVPPNNPVALAEKLLWLRDHPGEARAMGEAGRQRVLERFTWPEVVRRCLEIYSA